jgi:hypothetical protein
MNVSIAAQAADLIRLEAFISSRLATLAIENASDDIVGVMDGKTTKKGDRTFVGAKAMRLGARQAEIYFRESTASPPQRHVSRDSDSSRPEWTGWFK